MKHSEGRLITNQKKIDRQKWLSFVAKHPRGTFFHTPDAFELYKTLGKPGIVALVDTNGNLQGVCLYYIQPFGPPVVNRLFNRALIYGNLIVNDKHIHLADEMLNAILKQNKRAVYIELRNFHVDRFADVFRRNGFKYKPHLGIINNLQPSEEELLAALTASRRNGVRKALKSNLAFKAEHKISDKELDDGYSLISESYSRIKIPFPSKSCFKAINKKLTLVSRVFCMLYDTNGQMMVFAACLIYKDTFYGYYLGAKRDEEFLKKRPLDLFNWELMLLAKRLGLKYFDWMGAGSPDEDYGVRDFKKQYGGEILETGRFIKINKPLRYWLIFTVLKKVYKLLR
ncbi:MAG: peptidoglycan bridge formation glycyltransferase FemA/FemB family protein [Bacteroidetes bacterium]|nr:peptidoglycan bridge formation glycyltransferase FemA/FemB family protein [Bacteroidota bacterium]